MKPSFVVYSLSVLIDECARNSALSSDKLHLLAVELVNMRRLNGACAELGVWHGGSARLITHLMADRMVYLFDTFSGIPIRGENDMFEVGTFGDTSLDTVRQVVDSPNVVFVPGVFPRDVMPEESYCFVHVDADQYESTVAAIKYFFPRLVPGGVIVFDDWRDPNCPGVERALSEFSSVDASLVACGYQALLFKEAPDLAGGVVSRAYK